MFEVWRNFYQGDEGKSSVCDFRMGDAKCFASFDSVSKIKDINVNRSAAPFFFSDSSQLSFYHLGNAQGLFHRETGVKVYYLI
mgnify:CR=1 FL=1